MRTLAIVLGGVGAGGLAALLAFGGAPPQAQQSKAAADSVAAPVITDTGSLKGPRQPIFFRHDIHAGQFKMQCQYCHYSVAVSHRAGHSRRCRPAWGATWSSAGSDSARQDGDQEGPPGLDREEAGRVGPGALPRASRPLSPPATHQGARPQRLHHLPRRREPHAAGVQGEQREQHGLLHHVPPRAEGLARLLGVPLLMTSRASPE